MTEEPQLSAQIRSPGLPMVYRLAQVYLGVLGLCGLLAMWRVYDGFWRDSKVTLDKIWAAIPQIQLRELPELLIASVPVWMPVVVLVLGIGIWILRKPRMWALVLTFAMAALALLLILGVDDSLHRIEGNYYKHSAWVDMFWQNAYPAMVASIGALLALPGMFLYERYVR